MPSYRVIPYKPGSQSARTLAEALGGRRLKSQGSNWWGRPDDVIVNWGRGVTHPWPFVFDVDDPRILNKPTAVAKATNKLFFMRAASEAGVSVPPWTPDPAEVQGWVNNGATVLARTQLQGSGGAGIVKINNAVDIPAAPLYTKYVPKASEWRVHVFRGEVFDIQRKIKDPDLDGEPLDWQIRNHANGFVFIRGFEEQPDESVKEQAVLAVQALGLDFGAVDVIWNNLSRSSYVLEINTAPGLEGKTIEKYSEAIRGSIQ